MRFINRNILSILTRHGLSYPTPSNLNYNWNFGVMLGFMLVWQVLSGILLAMHYSPEMSLAYDSVEKIMRDVSYGWLIRYSHSGGAAIFFIIVYVHIARGIYFRSYQKVGVWYSGVVIFLLMMATGFLGYVLPWGQMSLWGATVITNLFSAIPIVGNAIVVWLWGGYSVSNPTLKRFFILHFVLPLVLIALTVLHLILLHLEGSSNPLGTGSFWDFLRFYPKFIIKDIFGILVILGILILFTVFWYPNALGHPDNYIRANPMVTPPHIVPEFYFLPFYAILRSIPNKLLGVIAMFLAILILFALPLLGTYKCQSHKWSKLGQFFFWLFVFNFLLLGWLGACVVAQPYIIISQLATVYYFMYFLFIIPVLNFIERKSVSQKPSNFFCYPVELKYRRDNTTCRMYKRQAFFL